MIGYLSLCIQLWLKITNQESSHLCIHSTQGTIQQGKLKCFLCQFQLWWRICRCQLGRTWNLDEESVDLRKWMNMELMCKICRSAYLWLWISGSCKSYALLLTTREVHLYMDMEWKSVICVKSGIQGKYKKRKELRIDNLLYWASCDEKMQNIKRKKVRRFITHPLFSNLSLVPSRKESQVGSKCRTI